MESCWIWSEISATGRGRQRVRQESIENTEGLSFCFVDILVIRVGFIVCFLPRLQSGYPGLKLWWKV